MKASFLFLAFLALTTGSSLTEEPVRPQRRIAYARDSTLWIANLDGSKARKLTKGDDPCISPDGTKIAFTMSPPQAKDVVRYIAVSDLATGATKIFKEMPSNNCFGPVWSPDGSKILFEIMAENHWRLGLLNGDGINFRFLALPVRDGGWFSACWAPDSQSIFCQDLEKICRFGVDGQLLGSWEISKIIPKGDMDSSKRLSISDDGKSLLIDANMDEEEPPKDWEGPPPAVWVLDIPSEKATRLTPKKSYAADSCWISNTEFLLSIPARMGKSARFTALQSPVEHPDY